MKQLTKEDVKNLIINIQNAVLCVLWAVFMVSLFVISLPIYVIWAVFNHKNLYSWTVKFCSFFKQIINK